MSKGQRLIRNSLFTLFNSFFLMATTWVFSVWVARALGPSNYGIFNLILWLAGTVSWVVGMGLIHAVTKFIAEFDGKNDRKTVGSIVGFVACIELGITAVVTILLAALSAPIADFFFSPEQSFFFFLAALGLIPGVLTAIFSSAIEGIQKFEYFTWSSVIISPLSFGVKVWVLLSGGGIAGLLWVMLAFSCVNALFYAAVLIKEKVLTRKSLTVLPSDVVKRIRKYNSSVMAILLCDKVVWDKSENFFLGRFCSAAEVGFYNLGFNVAKNFISILPNTFWRVLFPAMSGYFGAGDHTKMQRLYFVTTRYLAFVSFPIGIAGSILAYQILHYIYGHDYVGAQRVLQIILLSSIFSSMSEPGSAILYAFEKQHFILKYGLILAALNIGLDLTLIKPYGAIGAAICYAITTTLATIGGLIYTCTTMKLRYPFISVCKIACSAIIMGIVMELILLHDAALVGTFTALICGGISYLVVSLALGTFEEEDFTLLNQIREVLPGRFKKLIDVLYWFIAQVKPQAPPSNPS